MINKRNLDPSLLAWLMGITGLGPGIGEIHYLVKENSAYYSWLRDDLKVNAAEIHFALDAGENALTANRNDVLLVMPGAYAITASIAWDKSQTHLIGLGGPNQKHCPTTATEGAIQFKCTTSGIDSILAITGHYVQLQGFQTMNTFSHNSNRADIVVGARNTYMRGIRPRGGNGADQLNHADGGVPVIFQTADSAGFLAEDCFFGSAGNNARTVGPGAILFETTANAFAPVFRRCTFEMRCETNTTVPKLIHLAGNNAVDRYLLFDDCFFYNFWLNLSGKPPIAIHDECGTTHVIMLKNCSQIGFDAWCNTATYCFTTSPVGDTNGGEAVAVATT
jgi:hypothetical protein